MRRAMPEPWDVLNQNVREVFALFIRAVADVRRFAEEEMVAGVVSIVRAFEDWSCRCSC